MHVDVIVNAHLSSNQRLLLGNSRHLGDLGGGVGGGLLGGGNGLLGRGGGELGSLGLLLGGDGGGSGGGAATHHLLNLAGVVASVLLAESSNLVGLLLGSGAQLSSLGVDGVAGSLEVLVDELLVGGVDEGNEEGEGGAENGKAPVGDELDEEVGDEGSDAGLVGQQTSQKR